MQQQPHRWPGSDKCVETKLRWDVYIRPWPPGWSFLRRIYTSRGSERVKEVFSLLGVKLNMSTANHPQTDGMTERVNRIVEDTLRSFVNHRQTNWDELLALYQFSMNNFFQHRQRILLST